MINILKILKDVDTFLTHLFSVHIASIFVYLYRDLTFMIDISTYLKSIYLVTARHLFKCMAPSNMKSGSNPSNLTEISMWCIFNKHVHLDRPFLAYQIVPHACCSKYCKRRYFCAAKHFHASNPRRHIHMVKFSCICCLFLFVLL